jgi:hypothetical protein
MRSVPRLLIALAAGLALADAAIVTLALPPMLSELDATVEGVAAVLGVYTAALALALPGGEWLRRRVGARVAGAAGLAVLAAASLGAGLAGGLEFLLACRAVQAVGAAALLAGAFELLDGGGRGRRVWTAAAVFGAAAGPAIGGALTELLDWRAIFLAQVPVALLAAVAVWRAPAARAPASPPAHRGFAPPTAARPAAAPASAARPAAAAPLGPTVALALVSAALIGVLFLLVLLLVTGWSESPLAAAAAVSALPVAAIAGARVPGAPRTRAAAGCALVGGGVLALAWLPGASLAWTVAPQLLAGAGMGMALPALAGELLPERTPREAVRLLSIRHAGITLALAILAPLAAAQLDQAVLDTRERGAALVLDARLPPLDKFGLVETVLADLDPVDPRGGLQRSLERTAADFADDPERRAVHDGFAQRADEALVAGVQQAFAPAFWVCGALALLAALFVLPPPGAPVVAVAAMAVAVGFVIAAALVHSAEAPEQVPIANPCLDRNLPATGGLDGALQDAALTALDRAACRWDSSREELALALVDADAARRYEREHGVDPRDAGDLLSAVIGL